MNSFEVSDVIEPADRALMAAGLAENSIAKGYPPRVSHPLSIMQRDTQGKLEAGLVGEIAWAWFYIEMIWVCPKLRNRGLGRILMQAAEEKAAEQGCTGIYLWTQSLNAPDFYKELGYRQFVVMEDMPPGHQRIGFMKRLAA